ncbi:MAG: hypothetical protein B6242_04720 [Anaerolineaceae bacterium 4572_78]|nr:MAG: hypothetical protein B6242_04720 [Anaerolineaceae bacterium 4572_78]
MNNTSLPFDSLRPFKNKPEDFSPRDTLPWELIATNLLQCGSPDTILYCISPPAVVEAIIDWIVEHLTLAPQAKILDIGCGTGTYSHRLAQHGYHVTGIDIAQSFLDHAQAQAKKDGLDITYRNLSMFDMDFESEFDLILLINTITKRWELADMPPFLAQLKQALKPCGQVIAEFNVMYPDFDRTQATLNEHLLFLKESVWDTNMHAWLLRDLTFPETRERVNHHLILKQDDKPKEYWSRFSLHDPQELEQVFEASGFTVKKRIGKEILASDVHDVNYFFMLWGTL